ncbi:MAG: cytochrome c biogenesis protein CcdA [Pseudomonadota bacterium]
MEGGVFSVAMAFVAGFVSVGSPCVLPLIPSYLTYITGLSFEDLSADGAPVLAKGRVLLHALMFVAGFTVVFASFSVGAFYVGGVLLERYQGWLRIGGGAVIILMGLHVTGLLKSTLLDSERRLHIQKRPAGYLGSFAVGLAFAAGWSPCIGPILGSILIYAGTLDTLYQGIGLLLAYSVGFAVPFLLAALALSSFLGFYMRFRGAVRWVRMGSGVFMVIVGLLLITNRFQRGLETLMVAVGLQ